MNQNYSQYNNALISLEKRNIEQHQVKRNLFSRITKKQFSIKYIHKYISTKIKQKKYKKTVQFNNECNQDKEQWLRMLSYEMKGKKLAVYTCIVGNYDKPKVPSFIHNDIDFYLYTDSDIKVPVWKIRKIPKKILELKNNILINRYIKLHSFEFFSEYDYAIYIDGNIEITSDLTGLINSVGKYGIAMHSHYERKCIYKEAKALEYLGKGDKNKIKKQMERYEKNGFPENWGLAEATIILTDFSSKYISDIYESWWKEFLYSESYRDQLSFPYIMWKNGLDINEITTLGKNLRKSGKFIMHHHA